MLPSKDIVWIWMFDDFWTIFDTTCLCATASVAKLNAPLGLSVGSLTNVITFHLTFSRWFGPVISGHSRKSGNKNLLENNLPHADQDQKMLLTWPRTAVIRLKEPMIIRALYSPIMWMSFVFSFDSQQLIAIGAPLLPQSGRPIIRQLHG